MHSYLYLKIVIKVGLLLNIILMTYLLLYIGGFLKITQIDIRIKIDMYVKNDR